MPNGPVLRAVSFGEFVLLNAPRLWVELRPVQKQRLQEVLFPHGVAFEDGVYRTAETSLSFFDLEELPGCGEGLVALTGIEPVFED